MMSMKIRPCKLCGYKYPDGFTTGSGTGYAICDNSECKLFDIPVPIKLWNYTDHLLIEALKDAMRLLHLGCSCPDPSEGVCDCCQLESKIKYILKAEIYHIHKEER